MIGARIGTIISRKDKLKVDPRLDWLAKLPKFLKIPHSLIFWANVGPLFEELRYGNQYAFMDLEDANTVYMCMILSVGEEARGKGLGTELIKRGYEVAKKVSNFFLTVASNFEPPIMMNCRPKCRFIITGWL